MLKKINEYNLSVGIMIYTLLVVTYMTKGVYHTVFWDCYSYILETLSHLFFAGIVFILVCNSINKLFVLAYIIFKLELLGFQLSLTICNTSEEVALKCSNKNLALIYSFSIFMLLLDVIIIKYFPKIKINYLLLISILLIVLFIILLLW